jgi:hypothetical protein
MPYLALLKLGRKMIYASAHFTGANMRAHEVLRYIPVNISSPPRKSSQVNKTSHSLPYSKKTLFRIL